MLELIAQIGIFICNISSIYFLSLNNKLSKWGILLGLCAQPFMLYTAVVNEQWGLAATVPAFMVFQGIGVYNWFIRGYKK